MKQLEINMDIYLLIYLILNNIDILKQLIINFKYECLLYIFFKSS